MNKHFKTFGKVTAIVAISVFLFTLIAGGVLYTWWQIEDNKIFYEEKFDREKWLASEGEEQCARGRMSEDLMQNYLKKDMDIVSLQHLLGIAEYGREYSSLLKSKRCLKYKIGRCHWIPRTSILLVCFDENGKVSDFFRSDVNDDGKTFKANNLN